MYASLVPIAASRRAEQELQEDADANAWAFELRETVNSGDALHVFNLCRRLLSACLVTDGMQRASTPIVSQLAAIVDRSKSYDVHLAYQEAWSCAQEAFNWWHETLLTQSGNCKRFRNALAQARHGYALRFSEQFLEHPLSPGERANWLTGKSGHGLDMNTSRVDRHTGHRIRNCIAFFNVAWQMLKLPRHRWYNLYLEDNGRHALALTAADLVIRAEALHYFKFAHIEYSCVLTALRDGKVYRSLLCKRTIASRIDRPRFDDAVAAARKTFYAQFCEVWGFQGNGIEGLVKSIEARCLLLNPSFVCRMSNVNARLIIATTELERCLDDYETATKRANSNFAQGKTMHSATAAVLAEFALILQQRYAA